MALPEGVTTCTVTAGVPVTHTGAPVKAFVSIEPSVFLVHTATGTPLVDFLEELSINEGVAGQFTLPHTDQAGFQDENGNAYTNWYYTARISYSTPSKAKTKSPKIKVFQLATGQSVVDLDALPSGAPALPYTAPIATVTSVNGRTGPVTIVDGDLPSRLSEASLTATYATPAAVSAAVSPVAADVATKAKVSSLVRPSAAFRTSNPNRTMLTTFQDGHGFSQAVTSSFNYNDTTDYVLGKQSAYIVTNGAGGQAILTKSGAVTGLNMTGKVFALLLKVTNLANLNRITMLAGSGGFANNFQIQVQASNTLPNQEITPEGRWVWVTVPWNPSVTGGTPDRTNITDLRIAVVDNNTGQQVKVQVQAIATQPERVAYPNGVVSIGFDDNWASQSTTAIPYMERYGFQPTVYSIIELIGTAGRQSLAELKRIEEYSGGEVAAHSWTNATHTAGFTAVSTDTLETELRLMKEWLIDNGFQGRELLAYPMGNFNGAVMDIAAKYYKFARTVNIRQQETQPPGNPYTCRAQSSTNTVTLAQITAQIDAAYANGSWLNLLYHDIVPTPGTAGASVQVTQANFEGAMDYIATKGIPVRTVSQVLKATAP